jgi:hypothetical protein
MKTCNRYIYFLTQIFFKAYFSLENSCHAAYSNCSLQKQLKGGKFFPLSWPKNLGTWQQLAVAGAADMPVRNTARAKRQERQDVACRYGKGGGKE